MLSPTAADRALHALFKRAFGQQPHAFVVAGAADDFAGSPIVYANPAFLQLSAEKASGVEGRVYGEICHLRAGARCNAAGTYEGEVTLETGGSPPLSIHAVTLFDESGRALFRVIEHCQRAGQAAPAAGTGEPPGLAQLIDSIATGVVVHRDFRPVFANAACARLLGFTSAAEVMALPTLLCFLPLGSLEAALGRYQIIRQESQARPSYIVRALTGNGTPFWAEVSEAPIVWDGEAAMAISFADATEHARARKSEALLREAIDNLSDSFILYDADERVVLTNRRFHSTFPFVKAQEVIAGTPMVELVRASVERGAVTDPTLRDDNREDWIASFIAARRRNAQTLAEDTWPDGRWDLVKEQRLDSGGFVSVRTDITDRKRAEFALKEQESRLEEALAERTKHLEAVLTNIAQGVIVLDPDLRVVLTNPGLHEIVGYPKALGTPGTPVEALIRDRLEHGLFLPGEEAGIDREQLVAQRLQTYRDLTRESSRHPFPNGRHVEIRREKLPDGSIICTFTDVTERVEAERELQQQREALYQREKLSALGMLLAGVAHELNNPLSVVLGQSAMMESLAADNLQRDRAGRIRTAAERCAKIIRTFLAMARGAPASRGPVAFNELVEQALDLVDYQFRGAGIEVVRDLAPGLPAVLGDADQLNQIVVNLLINAAQAMEETATERRRVTIRSLALPASGEVELQVCDSGPGVPEEVRRRIFDPFFTTKPAGTGTGIGLSVCHGMVTAHGGSIAVNDAPGGGACFRVRLPQGEPQAPRETPGAGAAASRRQGRVLVIDDEADVCETIAEFLDTTGMAIDFTTDASDALKRLETGTYDVVLCDLRMPVMDGRALYQAVGRGRPELLPRFVFITGDLLTETSRRFLEESGRLCLEKPLLPQQVRRVVAEVAAWAAAASP